MYVNPKPQPGRPKTMRILGCQSDRTRLVSGDLVGGGRRPVHLLAQVLPVVDHQLLNSQQGLIPKCLMR